MVKQTAPLALLLALFVCARPSPTRQVSGSAPGWQMFTSRTKRFSVLYPGNWTQINVDDDALDLIDFPMNEISPGIVIPPNGAEIIVFGGTPVVAADTQEHLVRQALQGAAPISDVNIDSGQNVANRCGTIRAVLWLHNNSPGQPRPDFEYNYLLSCSSSARIFMTLVRYWVQEPRADEIRAIAMKIMDSLQSSP